MRKLIWLVTFWVVTGLIAVGVSQASSVEDQVMEVEHQRERAQVMKDFATLDRIMADDAIYCHATGHVDTKASLMETLRSGRNRYLKITLSDAKVRVDGNVAVINGSTDFTVSPGGRGPFDEHVVTTLVYEKRNGHWQMISSQSTRKPEPGAEGAPAAPAPTK